MKRNSAIVFSIFSVAALAAFVQKAESHRLGSIHQDVSWTKFDEYSNIRFDKEKARLDEFISLLRAERSATAYIVSYAGRQACVGEARWRANRVKNYLQRSRDIHPGRLQIVDAGYQKEWQIDLYLAPPNALPQMYKLIAATDGHLKRADVRVVKCKGKFHSER